ncbi:hypothetical protein FQA39_LY17068 [Lamprigera yunnana]|nr:hypothetical protein FQA39_LY17068 [Lamprigera yunnana]
MEKFKRHGDGESSEWPERKKRKQKKSSVIKIAKIKGEEHVNHVGKLVNKRQTGKDCRSKVHLPAELPFLPFYKGPNKISDTKISNLKSLLPFLSDETKRAFYEAVFEKQKTTCTADMEQDMDNDDNSSGCED